MIAQLLRRATAEDHRSTEAAFPLLDKSLTLHSYATLLARLHGLVSGWETLLQAQAPPALRPLVAARLRAPLLEQDLADLERAPSRLWNPLPADAPRTPAAWFGAMYVMEGSRLGGLHIAHAVEQQLPLQNGKGVSYFRGFGRQTKPNWQAFLDELEQAVPLRQSAAAILGARNMFATFRTWMTTSEPEPSPPRFAPAAVLEAQ